MIFQTGVPIPAQHWMELSLKDGDIPVLWQSCAIIPLMSSTKHWVYSLSLSHQSKWQKKPVVLDALIGGFVEWQSPKYTQFNQNLFRSAIKNFPAIKLSFEMICISILSLQNCCSCSNSSNTEKGKVIKTYLKAIGFSSQLIPALSQDILEGKEVTESLFYTVSWEVMQQSMWKCIASRPCPCICASLALRNLWLV